MHRWIEFGNRLVTAAILIVAVGVSVAAWRFRPDGTGRPRRDLLLLALAQPAGIVAQAVLGGIVVLTKLDPVWVSVHFLLSMALTGLAVMLYVRAAALTQDAPPPRRRPRCGGTCGSCRWCWPRWPRPWWRRARW